MTSSDVPPAERTGIATTSHDEEFRTDPHPIYDRFRDADAALVADADYGRFVATRHHVVRSLLRDQRFGVDARRARSDAYVRRIAGTGVEEAYGATAYEPPLVLLDDPDHRRIRTLVGRAFNARTVEVQRPRVQRIVDELLDGLEAHHHVDVVGELARPFPARVISEILGLDDVATAEVARWSEDILWGYDVERDADRRLRLRDAYAQAAATVRVTVEARRRAPSDDLVSAMVRARDEDDRLSDLEIVSLCVQLMVAGNVTTSDLIGSAIFHLLSNRTEWDRLVARPDMIGGAVEELLRFDCPITETARVAYEETSVEGCPVAPGDVVTLSLSAANHDPARFAEPHTLDLERDADGHLAFGSGLHVCLGAPLARMEAQLAIGGFVQRFPHARLVDASPPRRHLPFFRGLESLRVRLG